MSRAGSLLAVTAGGIALALAGFTWAMRTKYPPVLDAIRRFNRDVNNPRQLETAGQPGSWASIVHHVGRTSGTAYQTPMVPIPTDDGFLVSMPYGPNTDWVRNVVAAGSARITHDGEVVDVDAPRVRSVAEVRDALPEGEQWLGRIFGVRDVLELRRA